MGVLAIALEIAESVACDELAPVSFLLVIVVISTVGDSQEMLQCRSSDFH